MLVCVFILFLVSLNKTQIFHELDNRGKHTRTNRIRLRFGRGLYATCAQCQGLVVKRARALDFAGIKSYYYVFQTLVGTNLIYNGLDVLIS